MIYAMRVARKEKELYENLKEGNFKNITENEERNVEILSILEKLGYPMTNLGTYLYIWVSVKFKGNNKKWKCVIHRFTFLSIK